jgi:ParB family chromosome partitioning protein
MVTKLSPREKAALATQMMNKGVSPSPAPSSSTDVPLRQINSVQIGLAMAGQGGKVAELEKQLQAAESAAQKSREDLAAVHAEWNGILPSKKLDPKLIKPSKWANRHEMSFESKEFLELKEEIAFAGGNVQPIKVRPIPATSPQEYEIVFGHRRHKACLDLDIDVLAFVESIDDKELFKEMDRENRQRADLRPYEQGVMYARALDDGLFASQRKLAEELGVQSGNVSTAISIARLPNPILEAFTSPLDIQFRWAAPLTEAFKSNPDVVLGRASEIRLSPKKLPAAKVFNLLTSSGEAESGSATHQVRHSGKDVFAVSVSKKDVSIKLPLLSKLTLAKVERAILEVLKVEGALP